MNKLLAITLWMAAVGLVSCSDPASLDPLDEPVRVQGISLEPTTTVALGATKMIPVTIIPQEANNKKVRWESSNPAVVSITPQGGVIKGEQPGSATITVTTADGNKTAQCTATVIETGTGATFLVKKIEWTENYDSYNRTNSYTYSYNSDGTLQKIKTTTTDPYGTTTENCTYTRNNDERTDELTDELTIESRNTTTTYKLNADGWISSTTVNWSELIFSYNRGYLDMLNADKYYSYYFYYSWANGNLIRLGKDSSKSYEITYTAEQNLTNVEFSELFEDFDHSLPYPFSFEKMQLFTSGYLGKRSTNLPQKVEYRSHYNWEEYNNQYSYEFDQKGRVKSFVREKYGPSGTLDASRTATVTYMAD